MTLAAKLGHLRSHLGKTQKEFSAIIACSKDTIESLEQGRLKLSPSLAMRIQRACGVDRAWLTDDGAPDEMRNEYGESWTLKDFEECQERDRTMAFYVATEEMELAIAYSLLSRVYREARIMRDLPAIVAFGKDLEKFVRAQVHKFPHLEAQVEQENKDRDKRQKRLRPYLFPAGTESFKQSRRKLNEAIAAFSDWEGRQALKKGIAEKVREKRVENPDTSYTNSSPVTRNKSRKK